MKPTVRDVHEQGALPGISNERALVDTAMVQEAIDIEKRISAQGSVEAPQGESPIVTLKGSGHIIVTAPHATESFREGRFRISDGGGTAALAHMLNRLGSATVLYTQYRSPSDPNYYDDNEFKETLAALIDRQRPTMVLDIHGSHDFRPYDIDIGTLNGKSLLGNTSLLPSLLESLQQEGIGNFSDNYFDAETHQTITRFACAKGVPTIQLEISSTWLRPSEGGMMAHRFAQLLQGLARYARQLPVHSNGASKAAT